MLNKLKPCSHNLRVKRFNTRVCRAEQLAKRKKRKRNRKEEEEERRKRGEKRKRKSIFIFQHVTDETAMAPTNAMHQYSHYWTTLPPLIFYPHTHYQTHANGESNRVTGGANPRVAAAWRGGADLPPTQLIHSFYIILHARSFSRSVDRVLSGSRRRISGCIARLHSPSDSPSAIRSTIHTLLHLESYCGLGEWY